MPVLPPVLSIATIVCAIYLGFRHGRTLHLRGVDLCKTMRLRDMPLIPCGLLLYVALHMTTHFIVSNPQWGWNVPTIIEYYLLPAIWVVRQGFLSFSLFAVVSVAWLTRFRGRTVLAVLALSVAIGADCLTRYASHPSLPELTGKTKDGVILQSSDSTCAAAACANIATRLGAPKTEAEMAAVLRTTWAGTSPSQIVYGMRGLGFSARKTVSASRDIGEMHAPAVILVQFGMDADDHAVAFMGIDGDKAELWDPAAGKLTQTREEVKLRWRGHAIEIGRMER